MNTGSRIKVQIHGKEREAVIIKIDDNMNPEIIALNRPITSPQKSWPFITYEPGLEYVCRIMGVSLVDHIGWYWNSFTHLISEDERETLPSIPVAKKVRKYPDECPCGIASVQCKDYHDY